MRHTLAMLIVFLALPSLLFGQSVVLLLPPPNPPASASAQDQFIATCRSLWERTRWWTLLTFHKESPSLLRARREGRLPSEALERPLDHASALCAEMGAKMAFWVRVTKAEEKGLVAIEARLLSPTQASFASDLQEQPISDQERAQLQPFKAPSAQLSAWVLAWRLGQWLREQLPRDAETPPPADWKSVSELIAAGRWEEAIKTLDRLIAENPDDPRPFLQLGQIYERLERWDDAALEYRRALQLQGDLWDAWRGIARAAAKRGRWETVLDAVRRLHSAQKSEPADLTLAAQAAATLAIAAEQRGRDKDAETFRNESIGWDEALLRATDEPQWLLDAAQRLLRHQRRDLAVTALNKLTATKDPLILEQAIPLAVAAQRPDLAYQFLAQRLSGTTPYAPSREPFQACRKAMDAETVRLFEAVREALTAIDKGVLKSDEFAQRLQAINADADRLLKTAHKIRPPEPFANLYRRRLLAYELFLQATALLREWAETKDALTRTRAVVLYDFARAELENVWAQERQVR
ncbi:MAG: tetratricopeptide repeat protein [Armatimonadota bacterium]|jgi:tetratricopeptide (TPR) repeat protein|nr:tetratricopeptide repeat protein [Armatimonadota bacterium]MDT7972590.1 tetratricopeptide repeat protein [Armatimonadota bacterium]